MSDDSQGIRKGSINETTIMPIVPPLSDVAVPGSNAVQPMPPQVEPANPVSPSHKFVGTTEFCEECGGPWNTHPSDTPGAKVKRQPVDYQAHRLNWQFILNMGKIAHYADGKYGSVEQYVDGRLEGEKSPINHIVGHITSYVSRKPHDKFGNLAAHLWAIAYNAMIEAWYLDHGGPTVPDALYVDLDKEIQ